MMTMLFWVYSIGVALTYLCLPIVYSFFQAASSPSFGKNKDELTGCLLVFVWLFVTGPVISMTWPIALPFVIRYLFKDLEIADQANQNSTPSTQSKSKSQRSSTSRHEVNQHNYGSTPQGFSQQKTEQRFTEDQLRRNNFPTRFSNLNQQMLTKSRELTPAQEKIIGRRVNCSNCKALFDVEQDISFSSVGVHCPSCNQNIVIF